MKKAFWLLVISGAAMGLAACGGGGGSGGAVTPAGGGGQNPMLGSPISTPASAPTAGPTPSTGTAIGRVVDYTSGAPIAGATVKVGTASATTDAGGNYTVANAPGDLQYMQIVLSGYATYNSGITIVPGAATTRNARLTQPTAAENAWLAQINIDRAANGAGPVAFDEVAVEIARAHATEMTALKYYSHWDPNGMHPYQRYALAGGVGYDEESAAQGVTWQDAEGAFMAEKPNKGPHFQNLVDVHHQWVGLGIAPRNFEQNFVTMEAFFDPTTLQTPSVGGTIAVRFKAVPPASFRFGGTWVDVLPTPVPPSRITALPDTDFPSNVAGIRFSGDGSILGIPAPAPGVYIISPFNDTYQSTAVITVR